MQSKAEQLIETHKQLESEKSMFSNIWQEVGEYVLPNKANFTSTYGIGADRRQKLFDGTAEHALDIFSSSIMGLLVNPSTKWFSYATFDEDLNRQSNVANWLEKSGDVILNILNQAQIKFYSHIKSSLDDIGAFGTTGISLQPGVDMPFEFNSVSPSQFVISEDVIGSPSHVYRKYELTATQLMERERKNNWEVHEKVKKILADKPNEKFEVLHAVFPREDRDFTKVDTKNMPFASVYIDVKNKHVMLEAGFEEHPFPVARWNKTNLEPYGRSPAMKALADIKMVNIAEKGTILAMEKNLNPPLQVPSDGSYGEIDLSPGAINAIMTADGRGLEPIITNGNLPLTLEWEEQKRQSIRSAFFVDELQLAQGPDMTAFEVAQRQDEKSRLLAPSIGRIQSELIGPIIERCLAIGIRRGFVPQPPQELIGQDIKVVYVSPLTRAQRGEEALSIRQFLQDAGAAAAIDPAILDNVNFDKAARELHSITNVPSSILRDENEVEQLRQQRQQQQQIQEALITAQQGADVAKTANDAGLL